MFHCSTSSSGFIPICSSRSRKEKEKENEFDEKTCVRSRRTFLIFDICNMFFFLFSLSSIGEGAVSSRDLVFVAVVGFS